MKEIHESNLELDGPKKKKRMKDVINHPQDGWGGGFLILEIAIPPPPRPAPSHHTVQVPRLPSPRRMFFDPEEFLLIAHERGGKFLKSHA